MDLWSHYGNENYQCLLEWTYINCRLVTRCSEITGHKRLRIHYTWTSCMYSHFLIHLGRRSIHHWRPHSHSHRWHTHWHHHGRAHSHWPWSHQQRWRPGGHTGNHPWSGRHSHCRRRNGDVRFRRPGRERILCNLSCLESGCSRIDQMLCLFLHPLLVVKFHIILVLSAGAVGFPDAGRVVR